MTIPKRPTIYDLAEAIGVSVGTVYRALNNTGRISPDTKARIEEMAKKMNFQPNQNARALRRNPLKVGILLCCPVSKFLQEIKSGIDSAFSELADFHLYADTHIVPFGNPDKYQKDVIDVLSAFTDGTYSAVILFLSGETAVFEESIRAINEKNIPIVTLVNAIEHGDTLLHVSADGYMSGKVAAELLQMVCPQKRVAIFTAGDSIDIHHKIIEGFKDSAKSLPFSDIDIWTHRDEPTQVQKMISKLLCATPQYDGIYITSASIISAYPILKKLGADSPLKIITTDLYEENRKLLNSGIAFASIFQSPYQQGRRAVKALYQHLDGNDIEKNIAITPQIVLRSNMDCFHM